MGALMTASYRLGIAALLINPRNLDLGLRELPRRDSRSKQLIELICCTILCLWQEEKHTDEPQEGSGTENKADFAAQIASVRVEHVRKDETDKPLRKAQREVCQTLSAST